MELRQLEYFVAVAEEANFTRAAERVHISQSGVSAQIRQLERDLGAELFNRSARSAALTRAGAAALPQARAALAAAHDVRRAVDDVTGVVRGQLTVGMVTGCTIPPLFDALASFHRAHPDIEIALEEGRSDELVERVRADDVDLALIGIAGSTPPDLSAHVVISEGLAALVPPGHPLGRADRADLAEVCTYPVITLPVGTGVRAALDRNCAELGLHADVALVASAPGAVVDLAARGLGVAVLSASMTAGDRPGMTVVPIDGLAVPALLALVWNSSVSPARHRLLVHARRAFQPPT